MKFLVACRRVLPFPFLLLFLAKLGVSGCTGGYAVAKRSAAGLAQHSLLSPVASPDRERLDRWSAAVGPPVIREAMSTSSMHASSTLRVVSWNTAVGGGDVLALVRDLREADAASPFVLLLQEVYRSGPEVPGELEPTTRFPRLLAEAGPAGTRFDVEAIAEAAGLNLYYVPSMRNGGPTVSDEDRGNAILSSLPLSSFAAIELPFERQRRVAVAATISGASPSGESWTMRVASAHLDNMVGARRLWFVGGEFARTRQARALVDYLQDYQTVVLGGDFNSWFGFTEKGYLETLRAFPATRVTDRRPTFGRLLRLDHLFFRLPDGWTAAFARGSHTYGSDHYPLFATIRIPPA